jgi:magnesium transporter
MVERRESAAPSDGESFRFGRRLAQESEQEALREALGFLGTPHRRSRRAPPVGSTPGELALPPATGAPRIRVMRYNREQVDERAVDPDEDLAQIVKDPERVVWLDVVGYGDRAFLDRVRTSLDIHPLAMADVVNVPQRPKAELYGDRLLIITQMAQLGPGGAVDIDQVSLILGPGWVITFQERPGDVWDRVRLRIRSPGYKIRQMGADFLAYALFDAVIDGYFPLVEAIGGAIDRLEEEVMEHPTRATLARVHATRRMLLHLQRIQWRQRDALAALQRGDDLPISEAVRVYLRDAHDHAIQSVDAIETYREMTVGLMDVYLSSANVRMNEVIKTLTMIASIFIPLTFIVGVYGMNFEFMPELHWRYGYLSVWAIMVASVVGLLIWFRWRGWLGPSGER